MAYDQLRQQVVMLLGDSGSTVSGSTVWLYDGTDWSSRTLTTFPNAWGPSLVYDVQLGKTVLLGGTTTSETWLWDGTSWTNANPTGSPPILCMYNATYDSDRKRVVVFGGIAGSSGCTGTQPGGTWEWDGTTSPPTWTQILTASPPNLSPPGRWRRSNLAYDAARRRVVLFGGFSHTGTYLDDTWEYNGVNGTWTEVPVAAALRPFRRTAAGLVYHAARGVVLLIGGETGTGAPPPDRFWTYGAPVP
jgi:hypothetical protein